MFLIYKNIYFNHYKCSSKDFTNNYLTGDTNVVFFASSLIISSDSLMLHLLKLGFADYVDTPAPNLPFERVMTTGVSLFLSIANVGAQVKLHAVSFENSIEPIHF